MKKKTVSKSHAKKRKRVAVLKGGPSSEHDVSLKSARNVSRKLDRDFFEPTEVFIGKDGAWEIPLERLQDLSDVVFIALHGTYGEDGTLQQILDGAGIPYTGSGALTSALAMNKFLSARLFGDAGIKTPRSYFIARENWHDSVPAVWDWIRYYCGYPVVIKPNDNGSSVGVRIARDKDEVVQALEEAFRVSRHVLIQPLLEGKEITCAVLDRGIPKSAHALQPTEIVPQISGFFDYEAKYQPGGSLEITPARISAGFIQLVQRIAVLTHTLVGARGFSRTDMIIGRDGNIHVLEINTIPGLTEESLLPKAAEASGVPFDTLLRQVIEATLREG